LLLEDEGNALIFVIIEQQSFKGPSARNLEGNGNPGLPEDTFLLGAETKQ